MRNRNSTPALLLLLGAAATAGLSLIAIHVPFARDQGSTAYVAWVMAHGGVVYKDVFHFNLPAAFFVYLWAGKLLPLGLPENVNLLQALVNLLTYPFIYLIARRVAAPRPAVLAAVLFGVFMSILYTDYWDIAEKDSLALLPLAVALYAFLKLVPADDEVSPTRRIILCSLLAGLGTGVAAQFKPTLGIVLACGLYAAYVLRGRRGAALLAVGAMAVGFAGSFAPLAGYLARHHAFEAMYDYCMRFGGYYGGQSYQGLASMLWFSVTELAGWLYRWRFLAVLAAAFPLLGRREPTARLLALFFVLLLAQVIVQGKYFTYHFIPLLVPAAALAGVGAARLWASFAESRTPRYFLAAALGLLLIDNLEPEFGRARRQLLYDFGRTDRVSLLKPYGKWGEGDINPLASEAVADYIKDHTAPGDRIQIMGHESGIYVATGRAAASRYHVDQPLMADPRGNAAFAEYRAQMRAEFLRDLQTKRPRYILVIEHDATSIEPEESAAQLKTFPELVALMDRDYVLETKIEDFFVYRLTEKGSE